MEPCVSNEPEALKEKTAGWTMKNSSLTFHHNVLSLAHHFTRVELATGAQRGIQSMNMYLKLRERRCNHFYNDLCFFFKPDFQ